MPLKLSKTCQIKWKVLCHVAKPKDFHTSTCSNGMTIDVCTCVIMRALEETHHAHKTTYGLQFYGQQVFIRTGIKYLPSVTLPHKNAIHPYQVFYCCTFHEADVHRVSFLSKILLSLFMEQYSIIYAYVFAAVIF